MSKRYYANFPAAPTELVALIASQAKIPHIVDARVSADHSVFLDIAQDPDHFAGFLLTAKHLVKIAKLCGVPVEDVFVEAGAEENTVSVTVWATHFDFSKSFIGGPYEDSLCDARAEKEVEEIEKATRRLDRVISKSHLSSVMEMCDIQITLPGEEDSEDMIEATQSIIEVKNREDCSKK